MRDRAQRRGRGGGGAGRVRQGVPRAGALSRRLTVPALAATDRRQRGAQPPAVAGPAGGLWARAAAEDVSGGAAPSPEATVVASERRAELLAALGALRDDDRIVLGCRYLVGLSEQETAAALGLRRGTVKSRTARALERLRAVVDEQVLA